jgi:hypothetical protein
MAKIINLEINIAEVLQLEEYEKYKLHLACTNRDGIRPLDVYLESEDDWVDWNKWRNLETGKNEWNRDYILSLIQFHPKVNTYLFGGIFKVLKRYNKKNYELEEVNKYKKYNGRLLVNFVRYQGMLGRSFKLESFIESLTVNQIFEHKYTGEEFPGYDNINHDFIVLENIFKLDKYDWKAKLESVKGVYLLTDKETGRSYVGSAYGDNGIWSRWFNYINTFHGGDDKIISLVKRKGKKYIRENFKFSILEIYGLYVPNETIIERENYWKEKLMTRIHGYNSN